MIYSCLFLILFLSFYFQRSIYLSTGSHNKSILKFHLFNSFFTDIWKNGLPHIDAQIYRYGGTPTMENSNVLNLRSKITENRFGPWHPPLPACNMLFLYRWYNWIAKLSRTLMLVSRYQHKVSVKCLTYLCKSCAHVSSVQLYIQKVIPT